MTDEQWAAALATTEPIQGWITFGHHDFPIEWTWNLQTRMRVVDTQKPVHERALRRHCIELVPEHRVPVEFVTAWQVSEAAREAYCGGQAAGPGSATAFQDFGIAREFHAEGLLALALEFVPDAPWNGSELVFGEGRG